MSSTEWTWEWRDQLWPSHSTDVFWWGDWRCFCLTVGGNTTLYFHQTLRDSGGDTVYVTDTVANRWTWAFLKNTFVFQTVFYSFRTCEDNKLSHLIMNDSPERVKLLKSAVHPYYFFSSWVTCTGVPVPLSSFQKLILTSASSCNHKPASVCTETLSGLFRFHFISSSVWVTPSGSAHPPVAETINVTVQQEKSRKISNPNLTFTSF